MAYGMSGGFAVRRLASDDVGVGRAVVRRFKGEAGSAERMRTLLGWDDHLLLVAEAPGPGGDVIGFCWAYRLQRLAGAASHVFLYENEVAPAHRRQGVGTALVRLLLSLANWDTSAEVFVLTSRANAAAVALYQGTGAIIEGAGDDLCFVYPPNPRTEAPPSPDQ
jgi:ribosomal protein S18 acetylase RimI-like enzyme